MDKYNFPLGINYPSQLSVDNAMPVTGHADVSGDWNENRVGTSPVDMSRRDDIVTRSLFLGNSGHQSPTSQMTTKRRLGNTGS